MPSFGQKSMSKLMECHRDIQTVLLEAIKLSEIDFGITHGHRTPEEQFELYKKGRTLTKGVWKVSDPKGVVTYKDGFDKKSKHNFEPARAVDIAIYIPGKGYSWDRIHLTYVAGVIMGISSYFKKIAKTDEELIWGANWDDDGELVNDHNFIDMPHFQI